MSERLTEDQLDDLRTVVQVICDVVAPVILKASAMQAPHGGVSMLGEALCIEPVPPRDYRKELWIATYSAVRPQCIISSGARDLANQAVDEFDAVFAK
jgi:hypothetical protein